MNVRLFGQFLRDRLGLIIAFLANTGLLLALTALIVRGSETGREALRTNFIYGLLLSLAVIGVYLAFDFVRWWPFARRAGQLLHDDDTDPAGLLTLPPGGTADQRLTDALLQKFHRLSTDELLRSEAARRRHLDFINLWVHQMKTPVSAINVIAQQAEAGASTPEDAIDALRSIEEETAKLADGLDLVLNMARLEDFALDFHIVTVDVLQAVREAINARKKEFIRLGIYPEVEAADASYVVLTDAKWHRFVLDQIIANALKYGAQGGKPGQRLRFRLERLERGGDGGEHDRGIIITLAIADEGPGISPEDLPRVFDAFFTGQNGRRFANATGIGLFLVRQVAERLGHDIAVESRAGEGTTVHIRYEADLAANP